MPDTEILPPRVQTTIQVGTADITAMMVQNHIDGLKAEEAECETRHRAFVGTLTGFIRERNRLVREAYEARLPAITKLVEAINELTPRTTPARAALPDMYTKADWDHSNDVFAEFGDYFPDRYYNRRSVFSAYEKTSWTGVWVIVRTIQPDERLRSIRVEEDSDYGESVPEPMHNLDVPVSPELRAEINAVLKQLWANSERLSEIRAELKDIPNLERKVAAALTRQVLSSHPDLMRQVNAAITETGGKLLTTNNG